jgi:hypothetical protein
MTVARSAAGLWAATSIKALAGLDSKQQRRRRNGVYHAAKSGTIRADHVRQRCRRMEIQLRREEAKSLFRLLDRSSTPQTVSELAFSSQRKSPGCSRARSIRGSARHAEIFQNYAEGNWTLNLATRPTRNSKRNLSRILHRSPRSTASFLRPRNEKPARCAAPCCRCYNAQP